MIKKILLAILIIILIGVYWFFKGMIQQRFISTDTIDPINLQKVEIVAHRGESGHAPENSIAAFQMAMDMKADLIELDVHMSSDGEAIVIHDATLERTTNGTGTVNDYSAEELVALDNGSWFDEKFRDERIPTVSQVWKTINGRSVMLIEVKRGLNGPYEGLGKRVVDIIRSVDGESWCIVQAFDSHYIKEVNNYAPDIETQKLIVQQLDWIPLYADIKFQWGYSLEGIEVTALNSYYKFITRNRVDNRKSNGLKTYVYTVNSEEDMIKMVNIGVTGIITDFPDRLYKLKQ